MTIKIEELSSELKKVNEEIAREKAVIITKQIESLDMPFEEFMDLIQTAKK